MQAGTTPPAPRRRTAAARIAGYAFLILFLELALIRYLPGYVRVFGFYLNFVLIAAFLGMGVGLLRAHQASRLQWVAVPAALLLFAATWYLSNVLVRVPIDRDQVIWGIFFEVAPSVQRIGVLPTVTVLFTLVAILFVPLGALLGKAFAELPALEAYSVNVAASLAGVLAFALASAWYAPPAVWFGVAFGLWCVLSWPDRRLMGALLVTGAAALFLNARASARTGLELWSPYYRLTVTRTSETYNIDVNGSFHQFVMDFTRPDLGAHAFTAAVLRDYLRPYAFVQRLDTVLVLGSGGGNDVEILLAKGAKYIDAVEIDPRIVELGRVLNDAHPYDDPRVHTHIDDARAFLRTSRRHYDLIVLGTLDSQTLLSAMGSIRLDNYVYTTEAFRDMRDRLAPDGRLITYHMSESPYIAAKIAGVLSAAFGHPPLILHESDYRLFNYTYVTGPRWTPPAGAGGVQLPAGVALPHDNWPYLYLRRHIVPLLYLKALALVLAVAVLMVGWGAGPGLRRGFEGTMFFLGAGFLLVETKSVAEMSLLFGATWVVNVLVFSSILTVVLAANLLALAGKTPPLRVLFLGLFVALALAFALPVHELLWLGRAGQWALGGAMVGLPVFFSSWIFAELFRDHPAPTRALGYNLLGAIVGGVLEYSSLALGVKALYIVAALMYAAAWAGTARARRRAGAPAPA